MTEYRDLSIDAMLPSIHREAFEFYCDVAQAAGGKIDGDLIFVCHAYENVLPLVQAMAHIGQLRGVVLKNSTRKRHNPFQERLAEIGVPVSELTKSDFSSDNCHSEAIADLIKGERPVTILDHGGYFAYSGQVESAVSLKPGIISGIVEYTLNGELRHRGRRAFLPILSVGQSTIKYPADIAVSDAIVLGAEYYLHRAGINLFDKRLRVGIVGHGRLGAGISRNLSQRQLRHLWADDISPEKIAAMGRLQTADKKLLFENCNILFLATGNRSVDASDLALLQDNSILFTVTSPDDEIDLYDFIERGLLLRDDGRPINDTLVLQVAATGHRILLPFQGEAPNTIFPFGVSDPIIHMPNAAHLAAAVWLANGKNTLEIGVQPIPVEIEKMVARKFQERFSGHLSYEFEMRP